MTDASRGVYGTQMPYQWAQYKRIQTEQENTFGLWVISACPSSRVDQDKKIWLS